MKALLRKTARKMAGWPVIGRLVKIGVAVVRLPEFRASMEQALHPTHSTSHVPVNDAYRVFETEQLSSLLQAVSDVNHRQLVEANGQNNLVRSVPVSLRKMMREIVQLREQNQRLQAEMETRIGAAVGLAEQASNDMLAKLNALQVQHDSVAQQAHAAGTRVAGLAESVQYLLGRVEFVRRELMFEMRYGATAPGANGEQMAATSEILEPAKVEAARQGSGIRLNLGCGHVPLPGYLNVDRRALPGVDVVAEVDQLPFAKGEVAEICSAHLLEHFPLEQLRRELLPYWVSLLRADGVFRAIVPDGANMARAFASNEYPFENLRQVTFGGQDYDGDFHYNMFSVDSLGQLLRDAGFTRIEVVAENRENGGCKEFEIVAAR
jgi:predicted SAM-dependent methyltransferase